MTQSPTFQRIVHLPGNPAGRDFVVGDLHGHRQLFEQRLAQVGFDPRVDRVLSVGDLINRGPDSLATLALIEEPWFHAVLGNHELMLLNYLGYYTSRIHSRKAFASGAGQWIGEALRRHPKRVARLADRLAHLPLALRVDAAEPFHVAHADLRAVVLPHPRAPRDAGDGATLCAHHADIATASRAASASALDAPLLPLAFEGLPVQISASPLGALPITYVGHSPVSRITVHDSCVLIDQGIGAAPNRRGLTLPTVLEHRSFALWLHGVALARAGTAPTARSAAGAEPWLVAA